MDQPNPQIIPSDAPPSIAPTGELTPVVSPPVGNTPRARNYLSAIVAGVLTVGMLLAVYIVFSGDEGFLAKKYFGRFLPKQDYVIVSGKVVGGSFWIKEVHLSKPGFVAILPGTADEVGRDREIGSSQWLPLGTAHLVPLDINPDAYAARTMAYGDNFFLTLYHDDGDKKFDPRKDTIITNVDGTYAGVDVVIQQ
jgi:hypothetical protein